MVSASSKSGWLILLAYPASGLALGLADPWLGRLAQQLGTKPGAATAVGVNLLLPLVAVALGFAGARVGRAWVGGVAMALGLAAGLALCYPPEGPVWSPDILFRSVPPVLVAAALGYVALGTVAAPVGRAFRRPSLSGPGQPAAPPSAGH
jgi:hypothetical protein